MWEGRVRDVGISVVEDIFSKGRKIFGDEPPLSVWLLEHGLGGDFHQHCG